VKKHSNSQPAQPNQAAVTAPKSKPAHAASNQKEAIGSIMVMQSAPMAGLWKGKATFDLHHRWHMRGGRIAWEPFAPANAHQWDGRIHALADKANQKRQTGAFLRLSNTSQTRATWSLPAIAACPLRDETCEHCYAIGGWYLIDHSLQVDRVLRLKYLQQLIRHDGLATWIDWMVTN
jgi:hypothetical protein